MRRHWNAPMDTLLQDVRYAARTLLRTPVTTLIAVISMALGIGATATIFSAVNALLLRPFPYEDPGTLVALRDENPSRGWTQNEITYPNFHDWREQARSFSGAGAFSGRSHNLSFGGEAENVTGASVSASMFRLLGIAPLIGRDLTEDEDRPGGDRVVLLGHGLWQRRFGGDPEVRGRTVLLDGRPHTVIGVMPERFAFPAIAELWTPLALDPTANRGSHYLEAVARLHDGVSVQQARTELAGIASRLEQEYPQSNTGWTVSVVPLREHELGDVKTVVLLMMGAVTFVLLIACANITNLLLARAAERQREIVIRSALGAARLRIVRQLLTESVLIGIAGAVLGVGVAYAGLEAITANILVDLPFWMIFDVDRTVLAFIALVAVGSGILVGTWPAFQASRPDLQETLRESGRGTSAGRRRQRMRSGVVVAEVALSMILLVGATLMIRSFLRIQTVDPGFDTSGVLAMRLALASARYDSIPPRRAYFERVLDEVGAIPGVIAAAAINNAPLSGSSNSSIAVPEGHALQLGQEPSIAWRSVTPGYLEVMRIPLRRGRMFTEQEYRDTVRVVVVNETLAERFWPDQDPLGKRLRFGTATDTATTTWYTVVGVARDIQQRQLSTPPENQMYVPYSLQPWRTMMLVVRTAGPPAQLTASVRDVLQAIEPTVPGYAAMTMEEMVRVSYWQPRLYGGIFAGFALIALVLAAIGVYGVIAYSVSQRTQEIGVRIALGAQRTDVLRLVVGHGLVVGALGVGIGVLGALGLTRLLASLLFGVGANDPATFAGIAALLVAIALLASWLPARRAVRIDPLQALRHD